MNSTDLRHYCGTGDVDCVRRYLSSRSLAKCKLDAYKGLALRRAIKGGHVEIVRLLLEKGASTSAEILDEALRQGDEKIVDMLVNVVPTRGKLNLDATKAKVETRVNLNGDNQNVHDRIMSKYMEERNHKLDEELGRADLDFAKAKKEILDDCPSKWLKQVSKVLTAIEAHKSSKVSTINKSLKDLTCQVWKKAIADNDIKQAMYVYLVDCMNGDATYCAVGIASRLTSALYIKNPDEMPKTKEMMMADMLEIASQVQKENEDMEGKPLQDKIMARLESQYKGILKRSEIDTMTKTWIVHV